MKVRFLACLASLALTGLACGEPSRMPSAARQLLNLGVLVNSEIARAPNGPLAGINLAISEYNAHADSTYQVRLRRQVVDGPAASAAQAAGKLAATERLIGVVAPLTADETVAAAPAFEGASIPFLVTSQDAEIAPGSRTLRRLVANSKQEGAALVRYTNRRLNVPALIFHDGSTAGTSFVDGAKQVMEAAKRPVQTSQKISAKTDLEGVLGSVSRDTPSFVVIGGDGGLAANFTDVLRNKGRYKGPVIVSHQILEAKATGMADALLTSTAAASLADPELKSFSQTFSARYKKPPGPLAVEAYEGALMILEAIEEVEPKPREIVDFMQLSRSFLGESKAYEYDEKGELKAPPVWMFESKGGAWSFVSRSQRSKAPARPPE